ncbi:MAG TPA: DUF4382 domain-containing protein [Gemmatimonadales bacterium]
MWTAQWIQRTGMGLAVAGMAACSDGGPGEAEQVDVEMQQTSQIFAQVTGGWVASLAGSEGAAVAIDPAVVASLTVQITGIQFLPKEQEGNDADAGAWISLQLASPVTVDLMALPTEGESPLVIASGAVLVGDYASVRLFVDEAVIRFSEAVSLGLSLTFDADFDYDVSIPSGTETGIKTDAEFSVVADAEGNVNDVGLLFSPGATFLNVTGTGSGEVILAPVIRGRPEQS